MIQPISRRMHGPLADYPYIVAMATAPSLVGFADEAAAANVCRALSGGIVLSSLCTRAEWGLVRVIPFKAHLMADFGVSLFAVLSPFLFGFAHNKRARNTLLSAGVIGMLAGLLTKPEEMPVAHTFGLANGRMHYKIYSQET